MGKTVLVLGSAPDALRSRSWDRSAFSDIVAINNAWRVRKDWDYLVHPDDFPEDRRPTDIAENQSIITSDTYVPSNNRFGGVLYAGGTMAFSAGYWVLDSLKPSVMAFLGCDMQYGLPGKSHFYGTGTADPLRADITLRNLQAKSARLMLIAAREGCACVRLSEGPSALVFPSVAPDAVSERIAPVPYDRDAYDQAIAFEDNLDYRVPSGRYWEQRDQFNPSKIDALDALWVKAASDVPKR